jgi:hypothetical protein
MPEPRQYTEHRNALETLLRHIPGFRGYLEKEYRRDSDALQRTWLTDRLQQGKRSLETVSSQLADAGRLEVLAQYDRLRAKLDKVIARIRGAWQGYSGIFDLVRVDANLLDRVYEHDVAWMHGVEEFAESLERLAGLPARSAGPTTPAAPNSATPNSAPAAAPAAAAAPAIAAGSLDPVAQLPQLNAQLDAIDQDCDRRADLLKGLE